MSYATHSYLRLSIIAIVATVLACQLPCPAAWGQAMPLQDRKEITRLLDTQVQAWNNGDLDQFMETYWKSPELTFSSGGKTTRGWQATLDRYRNKYDTPAKMGRLKFDHLEFRQCAEDVVLVLGRWHLDRENDAPQGNFSLVWKNIDGHWRIIHDHSSTRDVPSTKPGGAGSTSDVPPRETPSQPDGYIY